MNDPISLEAHSASLTNLLQKCFAPWSRMPPEEWAEEIYRLPGGKRFRWNYAPYAREMFRSQFDRRVRESVFQMYSRGLKSTVILLATGYFIDQAPRKMLFMWPTSGQAEKFSKDALDGELFATTAPLNYLSSQTGKRIAANTILHKTFYGGSLTAFGANAPGELRRAKGSFLAADEIDAYESTVSDEGDILAIFERRGAEFPDTVRVASSYPSLLGSSRIVSKMVLSDGNRWYSTCVRCGGEPYVMHRSMLRYEQGRPETARMECPHCKELLTDAERYQMAHKQGFDCWKPDREFRGTRGFHANAMLWPHPVDLQKYPGGFLQTLAQMEIDAANSEDPRRSLRVIFNTVDAEPFDPSDEFERPPEWKPIFDRREDYGLVIPRKGLFLTCFVDCQKNRLELGWRAWGRNNENWGMDHVVIDGYIKDPATWRDLKRELGRKWKHQSGAVMGLDFGFIDGGAYTEEVYAFFRDLAANPVEGVYGHVQASKGVGKSPHPIVTRGKLNTVAGNLKGRYIGTWQAKDWIYDRLRMNQENPEGRIHYNYQYKEEFFQGLTIESATRKFANGEEFNTYKDEVSGNEPLDIEVGCLAAVRLRSPHNWDLIEQKLNDSVMERQQAAAPVQNWAAAPVRGWSL